MSEPAILISRLWINRHQAGYRSAQCSNICIALAYGSDAATLFDVAPRRPGRKTLRSLAMPALLAEPLMPGFSLEPRLVDAQMSTAPSFSMNSPSIVQGIRVELALFEFKVSMPTAQSDAELAASSLRYADAMAQSLEHWLGAPLAMRTQFGLESSGFFASGGDAGIMAAYQSPGGMFAKPDELAAWHALRREVQALDEAQRLDQASTEPPHPASKPPRL